MSTFWRPGAPGQVSELWSRCCNCGWSGPNYKFDWWFKGSDKIEICCRYWCRRDVELRKFLKEDGWTLDLREKD